MILHTGVMGCPVEGGPGSPEAHDCRVLQREGDLASKEDQSPTVWLVELHRKDWLVA